MLENWNIEKRIVVPTELNIYFLTHYSTIPLIHFSIFLASPFYPGVRIPSKERLMFKGLLSPGFKEKGQWKRSTVP